MSAALASAPAANPATDDALWASEDAAWSEVLDRRSRRESVEEDDCRKREAVWRSRARRAGLIIGMAVPSRRQTDCPQGDRQRSAWERAKADQQAQDAAQLKVVAKGLRATGFMVVEGDGGLFYLGRVLPEDWAYCDALASSFVGGVIDVSVLGMARIRDAETNQNGFEAVLRALNRSATEDRSIDLDAEDERLDAGCCIRIPAEFRDTVALNDHGFVSNFDALVQLAPTICLDRARQVAASCGLCDDGYAHGQRAWDAEGFADLMDQERALREPRPEERVRFLAGGLFPLGMLSAVVGEGGQGKGTLMLQLGAAVSSGAGDVFGASVDPDCKGGGVAYLSGEDARGEALGRMMALGSGGLVATGVRVIYAGQGNALQAAFAKVRMMPTVRLVVIDPVSRWMSAGRLEDSADVDAFLRECDDLAKDTGAAVVVVAHPPKTRGGMRKLSGSDLAPHGSAVWFTRCRQVLIFERQKRRSGFGATLLVSKCNLRSGAPQGTVIDLDFDTGTGIHTLSADPSAPASRTKQKAEAAADAADADASVVAALVGRLGTDAMVFRTGEASLYSRRQRTPADHPEIAGWSRGRIEKATDRATVAGLLLRGVTGALSMTGSRPSPNT